MIPLIDPIVKEGTVGRARILAVGLILALVIAGCGKGSGVGALKRMKQAEKKTITEIEARGGTVTEKDYNGHSGYVLDLRAVPIDKNFLGHLAFLKHITEIDLSESDVTDEQLKKLAEVRGVGSLLKLDVSDTQISDAGLMAFKDNALLFHLDVRNSNVTQAGIDTFKKEHPKNSLGMPLEVQK